MQLEYTYVQSKEDLDRGCAKRLSGT